MQLATPRIRIGFILKDATLNKSPINWPKNVDAINETKTLWANSFFYATTMRDCHQHRPHRSHLLQVRHRSKPPGKQVQEGQASQCTNASQALAGSHNSTAWASRQRGFGCRRLRGGRNTERGASCAKPGQPAHLRHWEFSSCCLYMVQHLWPPHSCMPLPPGWVYLTLEEILQTKLLFDCYKLIYKHINKWTKTSSRIRRWNENSKNGCAQACCLLRASSSGHPWQ